MEHKYDVAIIGGGPAGMAAALGAVSAGAKRVLLTERGDRLGGVLNQCTHSGFGIRFFGEDLSGVEYAERFRRLIDAARIEVLTETAVIKVTKNRELLLSGKTLDKANAKAILLASGCRERPIGSLPISGTRPSGVFMAGAAQRMLNIGGYTIGRRAVILGSGDVGMIVARELKKRGADVEAVVEQHEFCGGLERNRVSCLEMYQIPLVLCSTVIKIHGTGRITGVTIKNLVTGAQSTIHCDTMIVSVGLIPERELLEGVAEETGNVPDFLSVCGNACYVHDSVDDVTEESLRAGKFAAKFVMGHEPPPQKFSAGFTESKRGTAASICLICPKGCTIGENTDMSCGREVHFR